MAVFQIESNICTGRGFSSTSPSGYLAKFYNWITKPPASGGPGWYILRDKSLTPTGYTCTVNVANDTIISSGHGFTTYDEICFSTTGTMPGGIIAGTSELDAWYWVTKIDNDTFKISDSSRSNVNINSYTNITSSGTGTLTAKLCYPYIFVSNVQSPQPQQVCKIMQIYQPTSAASIHVGYFLGWNTTDSYPTKIWSKHYISTADSSDFIYDFRGGDECMILQSMIGTDWDSTGIDTWTGDANLLESPDHSGWLVSNVLAATGAILTLNSSGAYNFTSGEYYYMYDCYNYSGSICYAKCTNVNGPANQITLDLLRYNFPSGSVIGSYPHRFFSWGNNTVNGGHNFSQYPSSIPYVSSPFSSLTDTNYCFHNEYGSICQSNHASAEYGILSIMCPDDKGRYAMERINIREGFRANSVMSTSMNRSYGSCNNLYITYNTSMTRGQAGRTYGGKNYLFFMLENEVLGYGNGSYAVLFPDSESES